MANWYLETYGTYLRDIERNLYRTCTQRDYVAPLYWQMLQHHFAWDEQTDIMGDGFDITKINGKRARPLMVILVARAICGDHAHAMPAATAIELVHNFTLIHDDVMDVSDTRRGRITVWRKWDKNQAVNAGDGLYTWAMRALAQAEPTKVGTAMTVMMDACMATVEGQVLDLSFEERMDVTADEYLTMIYNKSGALIEGSARLGALLSTDDSATVDAYGSFAHSLGIAFQIQDDLLGIWGNEAVTGKSATTDIEGRKKSYPVLIAFDEADDAGQATLHRIYQQEELSADDVQQVLAILDSVNAQQRTRDLCFEFYDKAIAALDSVPSGNKQHDDLLALAKFLVRREY